MFILEFTFTLDNRKCVSKRIDQNHYVICQKQKLIENYSLDTCVVHTFKFYFMFYKCLMWPPLAGWTTSN